MKKQGKPKNLPENTTEQTQNETTPSNPKGSTGRKGIPIEKILACRKRGLTIEETAQLCGCSTTNIVKRCQELDLETLEDFNDNKVHLWDMVERKYVNKLLDANDKSNVADSIIAGTAHDKGRLIRGQATEIIDHRVMVLDLNKAIAAMRAEQGTQVEEIQDGEVINSPVKCPLLENSE